ncbi:MAG: hypothetical protein AB7O65_07800, partial [Candidatus Korobacteraceae bacterium]
IQELVVEFDFLELSSKRTDDVEKLYLLAKEGFQKSALGDFDAQRQILNRFCIAAVVLGDSVVDTIRRELRKLSREVKVSSEQIYSILAHEVLKRDVLEGAKAEDAKKRVTRATNRALKARAASAGASADTPNAETDTAKAEGDTA